MEAKTSLRSSDFEKVKYFHLVPSSSFYQFKLPRNKCVLERFFGLQNELGSLVPKKNVAERIYQELSKIYNEVIVLLYPSF